MPLQRNIDPYCPSRCLTGRYFRLAFIAGWVTSWLSSAAVQGEATDDPAFRELRFRIHAVGQADWNGIYYQATPNNYRKLQFWTHERSPFYLYQGPSPLQWFSRSPDPQASNGFAYLKIASLDLPHSTSSLLLIFIASSDRSAPSFTVHAIDESEVSFPLDTLRIFNATGAILEGILGDQVLSLNPGISGPIDLRSFWGAETRIGLAVPHMGKLQPVLHSKWTFYPDYRELLLLLPPADRNSLRVRAYRLSEHRESLYPPPTDLRNEPEPQD